MRGRGMALQQIERGGVIQVRAHDALERGMDLRQQAADTIADLRDLRQCPHNIVGSAT